MLPPRGYIAAVMPSRLRMLLVPVALAAAACRPAGAQAGRTCVVDHVGDGDSFRCRDGSRVRLIGVDAPELDQKPFGHRARAALERRMPHGTTLRLELDVQPRDRYGRWLAYAWRGDRLLNEEQLAEGFATTITVPPNVRHADRFREVARAAREERRGLWADGGFACEPAEHRRGRC
jgi:micrococcal nuclease